MLLKQPVSASIETLEGLLIFLDLLAIGLPDPRKSGGITVFPTQSKCLTHSATEKSTSPVSNRVSHGSRYLPVLSSNTSGSVSGTVT